VRGAAVRLVPAEPESSLRPIMLRPSDQPALRQLWTTAFAAPEALQELWSRDPRRVLVVREGGKVVGACALSALQLVDGRGERGMVWLRALAVREDLRGRGLGSRLVQRALRLARSHGRELALRARHRDLYARAGLQVAGSVLGGLCTAPAMLEIPCPRWPARRVQLRDMALACALATGSMVPLPGPRLRALSRHGAARRLPDHGAAAIVAREGLPWLAADATDSAARLVGALASRVSARPLRIDALPSLLERLPGLAVRDLGPWWCSAHDIAGDLPASVLSCLD